MLRHHLVMISGTCPGAGKSTLLASLSRELGGRAVPHRPLFEDDLLAWPAFARCDDDLGRNDPRAIVSFLDAAEVLAAEVGASDDLVITDALLPGFSWLLGRYAFDQVSAYRDDLWAILTPLRPLLVYLTGGVDQLFARAVSQRGAAFQDRIVRAIRRWSLPHYPGLPPQDVADVLRLYAWLDDQARQLLVRWPGVALVLDATDAPVADLTSTLAAAIGTGEPR